MVKFLKNLQNFLKRRLRRRFGRFAPENPKTLQSKPPLGPKSCNRNPPLGGSETRGGHWGGPTPPQPRFGGGANRPTTIEMVGGRTGGRRPLVGGRNRKIFAAPSAPRKKPYIPYYSLFIAFLRTNFQKMGNFNLFFSRRLRRRIFYTICLKLWRLLYF